MKTAKSAKLRAASRLQARRGANLERLILGDLRRAIKFLKPQGSSANLGAWIQDEFADSMR